MYIFQIHYSVKVEIKYIHTMCKKTVKWLLYIFMYVYNNNIFLTLGLLSWFIFNTTIYVVYNLSMSWVRTFIEGVSGFSLLFLTIMLKIQLVIFFNPCSWLMHIIAVYSRNRLCKIDGIIIIKKAVRHFKYLHAMIIYNVFLLIQVKLNRLVAISRSLMN